MSKGGVVAEGSNELKIEREKHKSVHPLVWAILDEVYGLAVALSVLIVELYLISYTHSYHIPLNTPQILLKQIIWYQDKNFIKDT